MTWHRASLVAALTLAAWAATDAAAQSTTTVKVIALNDFHGSLASPGSWAGKPAGGADYLAAYVASLERQARFSVVVAAGDLVGASPLVSGLFHDEGTVEAMNRLGLDLASVGNHEFDDGQRELLRLQQGGCAPGDGTGSCQGSAVGTPVPFEGARYQYLAANVRIEATGASLLPPYAIKSFTDSGSGRTVRVAFIGLTLEDTPSVVTPAGVAGLRFEDEAETVNALVPELRGQGVEAIVVLIHQGAGTAPSNPSECVADGPALEPIRGIVARLDDAVDLVVSGHTHLAYVCRMRNRAGREIPVTQAGALGRIVTDIDLTVDEATGDVTAASARNVVVDRTDPAVAPDTAVARVVSSYQALVAERANRVIGRITADVAEGGAESAAGAMIADAQLAATRGAGARIALMNRGGVRSGLPYAAASGGEAPGEVTYGELFAVQPFGNSLVTLTLTAKQLKDVLEQQFAGCEIPGEKPQTADRILQLSGGFSFTWDTAVPGAACARIKRIMLDGAPIYDEARGGFVAPVDAATRFRVTVNNFMAGGGDGFTVLVHGVDPVGGGQDIDALVDYVSRFQAPGAPYDPGSATLGKPRVVQVR